MYMIFWIFSGGSHGEKYFAREKYSQEGGILPVIMDKLEICIRQRFWLFCKPVPDFFQVKIWKKAKILKDLP